MQKIMMLAKLWCGHAEGFESGLRAWELDVGDWEFASGTVLADAAKNTVMMILAPMFLMSSLQLSTYANSAALRTALLQWCFSLRNFGASLTVSAGDGTGADGANMMQVDSLKNSKEGQRQTPKPEKGTRTSNTDINICKNCGLLDCWRPGGGAFDNSNNNTNKSKNNEKGKGKGKPLDVVQTSPLSETESTVSVSLTDTEHD